MPHAQCDVFEEGTAESYLVEDYEFVPLERFGPQGDLGGGFG